MAVNKLPGNPKNGDQVIDSYSTVWQFDATADAWIDMGAAKPMQPVSEQTAGLVTPEIFKKLSYLRQLYTQNPGSFAPFKILPGLDAHWYFLRSSNKLFRFLPEGPNRLRIEVDRGRLYQILLKQSCPGPKGQQGPQGLAGIQGASGAPEVGFTPIISADNRLDFAIFTPTPITTPISIRVYHAPRILPDQNIQAAPNSPTGNQLKFWEHYLKKHGFTNPYGPVETQFKTAKLVYTTSILKQSVACNIPLSTVYSGTPGTEPVMELHISLAGAVTVITQGSGILQLDENATIGAISYDQTTRIVCGSLFLASGIWGQFAGDTTPYYCVKSRQVGPDGPTGPAGTSTVSIIQCDITDSTLQATCPAISLRSDCENDVIYWACSEIFPPNCIANLQLTAASATVSDQTALTATFASVETTINNCKGIYSYKLQLTSATAAPALELASWVPQSGCISHQTYSSQNFDWMSQTNDAPCAGDAVWYSPVGVNALSYPWSIVVQQDPNQDYCCSDELFYCNNVQIPISPPPGSPPSSPPGSSTSSPPSSPPGSSSSSPPGSPSSPPSTLSPSSPPSSLPVLDAICLREFDANGNLYAAVTLQPVASSGNYASFPTDLAGTAGSLPASSSSPAWRGCAMRPFIGSKTGSGAGGAQCIAKDVVQVPVIYEIFCAVLSGTSVSRLCLVITFPVCPNGSHSVATNDRLGCGFGAGVWDSISFPTYFFGLPDQTSFLGARSLLACDLSRVCDGSLLSNPSGLVFTTPLSAYNQVATMHITEGDVSCDFAPPPPTNTGTCTCCLTSASQSPWTVSDDALTPLGSPAVTVKGANGQLAGTFALVPSTNAYAVEYGLTCAPDGLHGLFTRTVLTNGSTTAGLTSSTQFQWPCANADGSTTINLTIPGITAFLQGGSWTIAGASTTNKIAVTGVCGSGNLVIGGPTLASGNSGNTQVIATTPAPSVSSLCNTCLGLNFSNSNWVISEPPGLPGAQTQSMVFSATSKVFFAFGLLTDGNTGTTYKVCYVLAQAPGGTALVLTRYFYAAYTNSSLSVLIWGSAGLDPDHPAAAVCGCKDSYTLNCSSANVSQNPNNSLNIVLKFQVSPSTLGGGPNFAPGAVTGCSAGGCYVNYMPIGPCVGGKTSALVLTVAGTCPPLPATASPNQVVPQLALATSSIKQVK